jgi:hypothetical protein
MNYPAAPEKPAGCGVNKKNPEEKNKKRRWALGIIRRGGQGAPYRRELF